MAFSRSIFAVACVLACTMHASSALDYSRVWLVDHVEGGNYLFRGDMPINDTNKEDPTFAYDQLISYMRTRASSQGVTLPEDLYLVDVSLCNPFDGGYSAEVNYWKDGAHADQGELVQWPLGLAGIFPPCIYPEDKRYSMANSSVWKVDKVPSRIEILHGMLTQSFPKTAVIYVHCSAGCDRTGEVMGSYMMWYQNKNLTAMYAADTHECGRSPNYFSTSALEWFCYYVKDQRGDDALGNCCGFATCKLFKSCTPTGAGLVGFLLVNCRMGAAPLTLGDVV